MLRLNHNQTIVTIDQANFFKIDLLKITGSMFDYFCVLILGFCACLACVFYFLENVYTCKIDGEMEKTAADVSVAMATRIIKEHLCMSFLEMINLDEWRKH